MENFEALMCLGNLASSGEPARRFYCIIKYLMTSMQRRRMIKESDFVVQVEAYMFEDHQLIRRAAVQCFTNLCSSELQVKR